MKYTVLVVTLLLAVPMIAFSQDDRPVSPQSGSSVDNTKTPVINKRQKRQQRRIAQGEKSGQLTTGEAARLEAREAKIEKDKEKAKADGKVTPAERRKLRHEENRASRKIYKLKHNDKTQ